MRFRSERLYNMIESYDGQMRQGCMIRRSVVDHERFMDIMGASNGIRRYAMRSTSHDVVSCNAQLFAKKDEC